MTFLEVRYTFSTEQRCLFFPTTAPVHPWIARARLAPLNGLILLQRLTFLLLFECTPTQEATHQLLNQLIRPDSESFGPRCGRGYKQVFAAQASGTMILFEKAP